MGELALNYVSSRVHNNININRLFTPSSSINETFFLIATYSEIRKKKTFFYIHYEVIHLRKEWDRNLPLTKLITVLHTF